jgi:uncharacterized protein YjaZ
MVAESASLVVERAVGESSAILAPSFPIQARLLDDSRVDGARTMGGAFGIARTSRRMDVYLDASAPTWKESLRRSVIHECSHLIRAQHIRKAFSRYTLRDVIAIEGLAQCFEFEIMGTPGPYSIAVSRREAMRTFRLLEPYLDEVNGSLHRRAFFSKDDKEFKHWSGYAVSFMLVKRSLSKLSLSWEDKIRLDSQKLIHERIIRKG